MRILVAIISLVMTNNIVFGQSELENFTKSETERSKLNKQELRGYVSFLENISDSLLSNKNETIVELNSQLDVTIKKIISIENEIVELKTLQSKLESEKYELESEKSELESEKSELESEKSELEKNLEKLTILISKNNKELNLLKKLNGIENDTTKNNQNIKETGDGSVISVGELTLSPNGYKYQNKPYTGYLWNLQDGNYIEGSIQKPISRYGSEKSDLYFGMVKDGLKDGIWVESKNAWTNILKITKYENGKINNGFTLEIDWDISYYLIKDELRLNNFFDSLPDKYQFIEVMENAEEQTDNITDKFRYEGNKNVVLDRQIQGFYETSNHQEGNALTIELFKSLCLRLNQVKNPTDLLILLNGYITYKIDSYNARLTAGHRNSGKGFTIKIDNFEMGKKNGLSIETKFNSELLDIPGHKIPDFTRTSNEDVNNHERWVYNWDINISNYIDGLLDSVSVKGIYKYIKDGINRGIVNFNEISKSEKRNTYFDGRENRYDKIPKNIVLEDPNLRVTRTFEETSPNKTDITFFTSKPDFIPISQTDEYELENYKQGKKHGVQSYYKKGVLVLKEKYSEDELNGDKEVYKEGIIQTVETYSNGILKTKKIYENGILDEEYTFIGGNESYGNLRKFILKRIIYDNGNQRETWYFKKDTMFSDYKNEDKTYKITKP